MKSSLGMANPFEIVQKQIDAICERMNIDNVHCSVGTGGSKNTFGCTRGLEYYRIKD